MMLASHAVVYTISLDIKHTVSWSFLDPHSYLSNTLIHMLGASYFLFTCDFCAAAVVSVSTIEKELLFFSFQCNIISHCLFISYWPVLPHDMLHFFLVWPALYYVCLHLMQVCILICCCLYVLYGWTHWHVHWGVDGTYIYTHSCNCLVFVFCVVVIGQPVHYRHVLARLVCDVHIGLLVA